MSDTEDAEIEAVAAEAVADEAPAEAAAAEDAPVADAVEQAPAAEAVDEPVAEVAEAPAEQARVVEAKVIIGRKLGMTQFFTEDGRTVAVTVVEAGPCPVAQVKTKDANGHDAIQLAFEHVPARKISKAEIGHLSKNGIEPHRHLHEFAGAFDASVGETVTVASFAPGDSIKVTGRSKGKGFAGTIKRHNFSRGPKSHGSHNYRGPGSIGQSATPSRVLKGLRMAGHMGDVPVTQRGLQVLDCDAERNLLLIQGPVPGPTGGIVFVREDL